MKRGRKPSDIIGKKFGHLTVMAMTDKRSANFIVWKCKCDCGKVVERNTNSLRISTSRTSCGCVSPNPPLDIAGQKFGHLTAVKIVAKSEKGFIWLFQCDCGGRTEKVGSVVASGLLRLNCGCRRYSRKPSSNGKHLGTAATKRRNRMLEMLDKGTTKSEIAKAYGMSRERVGQILATVGR